MTTLSCQSLPEPIHQTGSLLNTGLPKTFPYQYPVPWCRKTYTKAAWYHKHVTKEHADLCKVESIVGVVLTHVTDAAVTASPANGSDDFKD